MSSDGPDERARLTPVDVVFFGMGGALVLILGPVLVEVLDESSASLSTPTAFLFQLIVPGLLMTLLVMVLIITEI